MVDAKGMTPAEVFKESVSFIRRGESINAIRLIRLNYPMTLREAYDLVNAISNVITRNDIL